MSDPIYQPAKFLYAAALALGLALLGTCTTRPAYAHMTDPAGCELLIMKAPDRKTALAAGLSDDQVVFNYGYDMNGDGRIDLIVGYQVIPKAQWPNPRIPAYLDNPVSYWRDGDGDGKMEHLFIPLGGQYTDCTAYVHLYWDGDKWVLIQKD